MKNTQQDKIISLQNQINQLEIKASFQEHTIELLNEIVTKQQNDIDKITIQLHFLLEKFKATEPSNIASSSEETPPPHY